MSARFGHSIDAAGNNKLKVEAGADGEPVKVQVGETSRTIKAGKGHTFKFKGS